MHCYDLAKNGAGNPKWRGGQYLCDGYLYIYAPNHPNATKMGYVVEHRLVMERTLGRTLARKEVVHHVDGNKLNNKPKNLVLCQSTGHHFITEHFVSRDEYGRFKTTK